MDAGTEGPGGRPTCCQLSIIFMSSAATSSRVLNDQDQVNDMLLSKKYARKKTNETVEGDSPSEPSATSPAGQTLPRPGASVVLGMVGSGWHDVVDLKGFGICR